jgi:hypothetical protein
MKKSMVALCLAATATLSTTAYSACPTTTQKGSDSPGIFMGITYAFGSKYGLGFTLQATSSRRDDRGVVAAGVSYYPNTGKVGIPLSLGYQKSDTLVLGGYDLLLQTPVIHGGYTNTSKDKTFQVCDEEIEESDIRLKHDIHELAVLENGLKIYSFKYKSRDGDFVGVMAQDLLSDPRWSKAVVRRQDGHYLVNYGELEIRMTTLENWTKNGKKSVLRSHTEAKS